jgi:hypothetical protein
MSSDIDPKMHLRRLSATATQAKMDLHDLSEELPINWQQIMDIAQRAYDAFAALEQARATLN